MAGPVDGETLAKLLDEHGAALEWYAAQWVEAPEDCVQEAFIELARQRECPQNAAAWLFRVVRNRAISMARSRDRRRRHESQAGRLRLLSHCPEAPAIDPDSLAQAIDELDQTLREALVARIWGRLSFEQIGQVMGISTSGAQRHYVAALKALRERLDVTCANQKPH